MTKVAALPPLPAAVPAPDDGLPHLPGGALSRLRCHEQQAALPNPLRERSLSSARAPIHERHTASSRQQALADPDTECAAAIRAVLRSGKQEAHGSGALPHLPAGVLEYVQRRGQSMRELVDSKRQIFLAQMSLDTKRSEIAKLQQRARQWDEALLASEAALEADFKRFEDHLKESDARLQEVLGRAEAEGRARADREAEVKRLASSIAAMRSEMGKVEEQLEECGRLKAFLDSVTPQEWVEAQAAKKAARREAVRSAWQAQHDALVERRAAAAAAAQRAEHDMRWARTQQQFEGAERAHRDAVATLQDVMAEQDPPEPDSGDAQEEGEGEAEYFQEPGQLLAVFSAMEGSSMFQIQAAQDAEAALEAATAAAAAAAAQDGEVARLQRQAAELEAAVAAHRARGAQLRALAEQRPDCDGQGGAGGAAAGGGTGAVQGGPAAELEQAVAAAYEAAGFVRDAAVSPLQMLQKVEARMEEWLAAVGPPGGPGAQLAEQVEKARERERRQAARASKAAAQLAEQEARVERVLARAAAPRFQRRGKPTMARSMLRRARPAAGCQQGEGQGDELLAFLARVDAGIPPEA